MHLMWFWLAFLSFKVGFVLFIIFCITFPFNSVRCMISIGSFSQCVIMIKFLKYSSWLSKSQITVWHSRPLPACLLLKSEQLSHFNHKSNSRSLPARCPLHAYFINSYHPAVSSFHFFSLIFLRFSVPQWTYPAFEEGKTNLLWVRI